MLAVGVSHLTMALDLKISPPKLMELALHKKHILIGKRNAGKCKITYARPNYLIENLIIASSIVGSRP